MSGTFSEFIGKRQTGITSGMAFGMLHHNQSKRQIKKGSRRIDFGKTLQSRLEMETRNSGAKAGRPGSPCRERDFLGRLFLFGEFRRATIVEENDMYTLNRRFGFLLILSLIAMMFFLFCTSGFAGDATLSWDANSDPNVSGYKVYYGTATRSYGTPIDLGNQTNYSLTGLGLGTYYFAVTAYNTSGLESVFSNEVSKAFSSPNNTPNNTDAQQALSGGGCAMISPTLGNSAGSGGSADLMGLVLILSLALLGKWAGRYLEEERLVKWCAFHRKRSKDQSICLSDLQDL